MIVCRRTMISCKRAGVYVVVVVAVVVCVGGVYVFVYMWVCICVDVRVCVRKGDIGREDGRGEDEDISDR